MDTPVKKRVKRVYITATVSLTQAAGDEGAVGSYQFQEDVRIIGWAVRVSAKPEGAKTENEGELYGNAVLSPAVGAEQPILAEQPMIVRYNTSGSPHGNLVEHQEVMFPEGYGLDIDTGEYLYCSIDGTNNLYTEAVAISAVARVFYVER